MNGIAEEIPGIPVMSMCEMETTWKIALAIRLPVIDLFCLRKHNSASDQ